MQSGLEPVAKPTDRVLSPHPLLSLKRDCLSGNYFLIVLLLITTQKKKMCLCRDHVKEFSLHRLGGVVKGGGKLMMEMWYALDSLVLRCLAHFLFQGEESREEGTYGQNC